MAVRSRFVGMVTLGAALVTASCSYDYAGARRCSNGAKDGDETEVDCGGSCRPCADAGVAVPNITRRWQQLDVISASPPARYAHAMVYERTSPGRVLLFSGLVEAQAVESNDTWTLNDETWTPHSPASPPAQRHYAMAAYDEIGARTIVAGGRASGATTKEVWAWDGSSWSSIDALPSATQDGALLWNTQRQLPLLFGANVTAIETLELQNGVWAKLTAIGAAPTGEGGFGAAFDRERRLGVVLARSGETWQYDRLATAWTRNTDAGGPGARCGVAMAYDEHRKVIVLFGGATGTCNSPKPTDDTWEYDGERWQLVPTDGKPPARFYGKMVYDVERRRMVLFGGANASHDPIPASTWIYVVLGTPCSNASECGTGHCVDGVCCESASCGTDQICNGPEKPGICVSPP